MTRRLCTGASHGRSTRACRRPIRYFSAVIPASCKPFEHSLSLRRTTETNEIDESVEAESPPLNETRIVLIFERAVLNPQLQFPRSRREAGQNGVHGGGAPLRPNTRARKAAGSLFRSPRAWDWDSALPRRLSTHRTEAGQSGLQPSAASRRANRSSIHGTKRDRAAPGVEKWVCSPTSCTRATLPPNAHILSR
jgi:hypothetical protein